MKKYKVIFEVDTEKLSKTIHANKPTNKKEYQDMFEGELGWIFDSGIVAKEISEIT